jgi:tellurite resistance protein
MSKDEIDLEHPAHDLSEEERVEYLLAVGSLVAAERSVHPAEIESLRAICHALGVTRQDEAKIVASAIAPDAARVDAELGRLRHRPDLATSLLADAIAIAFSNEQLERAEADVLGRMAERLGMHVGQVELIARYVESVRLGGEHASHPHLASELGDALVHAHPKTRSGVQWLRRILGRR